MHVFLINSILDGKKLNFRFMIFTSFFPGKLSPLYNVSNTYTHDGGNGKLLMYLIEQYATFHKEK